MRYRIGQIIEIDGRQFMVLGITVDEHYDGKIDCQYTITDAVKQKPKPKPHNHDFGGDEAETFARSCKSCGKVLSISQKRTEHPCSFRDLFVRCQCGESVHFTIPHQ